MPQNDPELRALVQRMIDRGESRDAIAEVVQNYGVRMDQQRIDAIPAEPLASHALTEPPAARPIATGGGRGTGLDVRKSDQWAKDNAPTIGAAMATAHPAAWPARLAMAAMGGTGGALARGDDPTTAVQAGGTQGAIEGATMGASKLLGSGAKKLYTSLLKPKDATLARFPGVVDDLIANRRIISQGSRRGAVESMREIGKKKGAVLAAADATGARIPREELRAGLDTVLDESIRQSDTPVKDLGKLAKMERDFIPDESSVLPSRADAMKSKLQAESDRTYRQMKTGTRVTDTTAKGRTALAARAKTAVERVAPDVAGLNAAYASSKGQSQALRDALKREGNTHVIGMRDFIGSGTGLALGGGPGAVAGLAATRLLAHPTTGSMAAIGANELGKMPMAQLVRLIQMSQLGQE